MSRTAAVSSDLTAKEQGNVRVALRVLAARAGNRKALAKVLRYEVNTIRHVLDDKVTVSVNLAFRVSRLAGVTLDDLLAGKYPPAGICRKCGHQVDGAGAAR